MEGDEYWTKENPPLDKVELPEDDKFEMYGDKNEVAKIKLLVARGYLTDGFDYDEFKKHQFQATYPFYGKFGRYDIDIDDFEEKYKTIFNKLDRD